MNLDKIMHARWDFDASSARTRRVSALDSALDYQQNIITRLENKSTLRSRKPTLCDAYAHVSTARDIRSAIVQK